MKSRNVSKKWWLITLAGFGVAGAVALHFSSTAAGDGGKKSDKPLPLVSTTFAKTTDLPIKFASQGHVVPLNQVDVRSQITASIRSTHFQEGDDVQAGQLLFTLEGGDQLAQLNQAQANVAQMLAQLDDARRNYKRSQELVQAKYISSSALDTLASNVESLSAQLQAARAQVESAKVQASYTRIHAPIAGRAGAVDVHPGSLAQAGDATPLVSLIQFDPIGIEFTLPEQQLTPLLAAQAAGLTKVSATLPDGHEIEGDLTFINYAVSSNTGTINLKARFTNAQQQLWPGAFIKVTLDAGLDRNAIVLPPQAVLEGPKGHFVFNMGGDGKVSSHPVSLLRIQDQQAVVSGVADGEQVIVEGNQDLRAGMFAKVANEPAAKIEEPAAKQ